MFRRIDEPRFMIRAGFLFLVIALLMQWKQRGLFPAWPDLGDFAMGLAFGIAIGFLLLGVRANARRARGCAP